MWAQPVAINVSSEHYHKDSEVDYIHTEPHFLNTFSNSLHQAATAVYVSLNIFNFIFILKAYCAQSLFKIKSILKQWQPLVFQT